MEQGHHLADVLVLLLAVFAFVPLFQRFKLGTVLAYLTAGLVIGPSALSLVSDVEAARPFAELGVVFMLFSVGLEISPGRLKRFGRGVYGLAVLQVVLTTLVLAAAAWWLDFAFTTALVIGAILTFSSTAVALQLLSERGQLSGQVGRVAIAVLLIQDLAVAPWIVFVNTAAEPVAQPLTVFAFTALKFVLFCVAMWLFDRRALRPLMRLAVGTQAPEVFMAAILLVVLGIGWLSETLGLSMALGAFVAGMILADTEFRHQVSADIQPFRGLLLGLFFMTIGMGVDLSFVAARIEQIGAIVVVVMTVKALILIGLARAFGLSRGRALALGGLLSQFSEFAFVLLALSVHAGLLGGEEANLLTAAVGLSMAVTPIGASLLERLLPPGRLSGVSSLGPLQEKTERVANHVVIAGFGQVGMAVARFLAGARVPVLVLDLMPRRVTASRARGLPVFYGNATRLDVLRAAHLERAHALVVAVPDAVVGEQITIIAKQAFPHLSIIVRAPDESWLGRLKAAGAGAVVLEGLTTALDLAERVMLVYVPEEARPDPTP
jgi:CPA2 family monovalent cation:H+ antiporter-2